MEPLLFSRKLSFDAPAGAFWPFISNTDRINRALGLGQVTYETPPPGSLVRPARTKLAGLFTLSWDEPPFQWIENQFHIIRRRYHGGPLAEIESGVRIAPDGPRTGLELYLEVTPKNWLGVWAGRTNAEKYLTGLEALCARFAQAARGGADYAFARPAAAPDCDSAELRRRLKAAGKGLDEALAQRLALHLERGFDEEVVGMRPFELADRWRVKRLDVLRAFLHASRAGVLDVSWEVLCPNCRVAQKEVAKLGDLRSESHCGTCEITFSSGFDEMVEVRFSANPSVRRTAKAIFCVGGPANTPHRTLQLPLTAGGSRSARLELGDRRYRMHAFKEKGGVRLRPDPGGAASLKLPFRGGACAGEELAFRPGPVTLELSNEAGGPELWVALDEESWSDKGATAALVTSIQEFRDLFSSELLAPDQNIAIKSLAVMFTDLKDSTAMYERIGDASAFALVRTHFLILLAAIRAHNGALVKTIGDAVMAVFSSTEDAVRAAVEIQREVDNYNRENAGKRERIIVKLGLHAGPAIAITSNETLDYFGTTINLAARVQGTSVGADIVVSDEVVSVSGVRAILEADGGRLEDFTEDLKGIAQAHRLWRYLPKK